MASAPHQVVALHSSKITGRNGLIDRYFYFVSSLLFAAIVVWGFSQSVGNNLFHATPPRPLLLWIHGAAFSGWVIFYILQSALVRTRNVAVHRFLGWFGAGLAATMVVLGVIISVIMGRFDAVALHLSDPTFLAIPWFDMVGFGTLVGLAIYWRKKPELHRRLLFLASCSLMDAPFGRFAYVFNHHMFYVCLDGVILLGLLRDLAVNRSIHKVYRIAVPAVWAGQCATVFLWVGAPAWWLHLTKSVLGIG